MDELMSWSKSDNELNPEKMRSIAKYLSSSQRHDFVPTCQRDADRAAERGTCFAERPNQTAKTRHYEMSVPEWRLVGSGSHAQADIDFSANRFTIVALYPQHILASGQLGLGKLTVRERVINGGKFLAR